MITGLHLSLSESPSYTLLTAWQLQLLCSSSYCWKWRNRNLSPVPTQEKRSCLLQPWILCVYMYTIITRWKYLIGKKKEPLYRDIYLGFKLLKLIVLSYIAWVQNISKTLLWHNKQHHLEYKDICQRWFKTASSWLVRGECFFTERFGF